ncbi:MAG: hypothetical protein KAR23_05955 [Candidatus Aenigmarchaeota archaeon]|nr:hypothetical protein [Candidatus Aenigmarchaeota archaeon]
MDKYETLLYENSLTEEFFDSQDLHDLYRISLPLLRLYGATPEITKAIDRTFDPMDDTVDKFIELGLNPESIPLVKIGVGHNHDFKEFQKITKYTQLAYSCLIKEDIEKAEEYLNKALKHKYPYNHRALNPMGNIRIIHDNIQIVGEIVSQVHPYEIMISKAIKKKWASEQIFPN